MMSARKQPKKIKITRPSWLLLERPDGSKVYVRNEKLPTYMFITDADIPEYKDAHIVFVDKEGKEIVIM